MSSEPTSSPVLGGRAVRGGARGWPLLQKLRRGLQAWSGVLWGAVKSPEKEGVRELTLICSYLSVKLAGPHWHGHFMAASFPCASSMFCPCRQTWRYCSETVHSHCHGSFATLDPEPWTFRQGVLWTLVIWSRLLVSPVQFLEAFMTLANCTMLPNPQQT